MSEKKVSGLSALNAAGLTGSDLLLITTPSVVTGGNGTSSKITVADFLSAASTIHSGFGSTGATGIAGNTGATGSTGLNGSTGATGVSFASVYTYETPGFGASINAVSYSCIIVNVHDSASSFTLNITDGQQIVVLFIQDNTGGWNCGVTNAIAMPSITDQTLNQGPSIVTAFTFVGFQGSPLLINITK